MTRAESNLHCQLGTAPLAHILSSFWAFIFQCTRRDTGQGITKEPSTGRVKDHRDSESTGNCQEPQRHRAMPPAQAPMTESHRRDEKKEKTSCPWTQSIVQTHESESHYSSFYSFKNYVYLSWCNSLGP